MSAAPALSPAPPTSAPGPDQPELLEEWMRAQLRRAGRPEVARGAGELLRRGELSVHLLTLHLDARGITRSAVRLALDEMVTLGALRTLPPLPGTRATRYGEGPSWPLYDHLARFAAEEVSAQRATRRAEHRAERTRAALINLSGQAAQITLYAAGWLLREQPQITAPELAVRTGRSAAGTRRILAEMTRSGLLARAGSAAGSAAWSAGPEVKTLMEAAPSLRRLLSAAEVTRIEQGGACPPEALSACALSEARRASRQPYTRQSALKTPAAVQDGWTPPEQTPQSAAVDTDTQPKLNAAAWQRSLKAARQAVEQLPPRYLASGERALPVTRDRVRAGLIAGLGPGLRLTAREIGMLSGAGDLAHTYVNELVHAKVLEPTGRRLGRQNQWMQTYGRGPRWTALISDHWNWGVPVRATKPDRGDQTPVRLAWQQRFGEE